MKHGVKFTSKHKLDTATKDAFCRKFCRRIISQVSQRNDLCVHLSRWISSPTGDSGSLLFPGLYVSTYGGLRGKV